MEPRILCGTRRSIGRQKGVRIRDLRLVTPTEDDREFARHSRSLVETHHPAIVEEFNGLVETSGIEPAVLESHYFGRTHRLPGCTNLAVTPGTSRNGRLLAGRNYDWSYADRRWCEGVQIAPSGEPVRLGYTHHWSGLCDGMNESGLTILIAALHDGSQPRPGFQWHIAVDMVLSRATNVEQAMDLLRGVPHVRSMSYLIADTYGTVLVQVSDGVTFVVEPENGLLAGTNHLVSEEARVPGALQNSVTRRQCALRLLRQRDQITTRTLREVLSDHSSGICAGEHGESIGGESAVGGSGTIWSLIAVPERKTLLIARGHPCREPYRMLRWLPVGNRSLDH
jgi:predicted choloylglycine hydrolase